MSSFYWYEAKAKAQVNSEIRCFQTFVNNNKNTISSFQ